MKRPGSTKHQFRQRIPADVLDKAPGTPLAIPLGDGVVSLTISLRAAEVTFSLRTSDPREAKARNGVAADYLERVWQSLRDGPARLTHKQAVALAGEAYEAWTVANEDDPVTAGVWSKVWRDNAAARRGEHGASVLMIGDAARRASAMDERFGGLISKVLTRHALSVDRESRDRLMEALADAMDAAAVRLFHNAEGDYSPDEHAKRYPAWQGARVSPPQPAARFSKKDLIEGWWAEGKASGLTPATHESYSNAANQFFAFLGHEDATRVTPEDVVRFKDHRLSFINPRTGKPVSAATVRDGDLAGLKSLFGWAVRNRKLPGNPAAGITIKRAKKVQTRPKGLTDSEALAILQAATAYQSRTDRPKVVAAKRWVPWLCAYTGARVGEMVQLRGQDVRQERGVWVLHITPEAGTVKDKTARDVALHPHLIEMGFPAFAKAAGRGHLFLTVGQDGDWRGPWRDVRNRVGKFAKTALKGAKVAPNHGWRHRFKTVGRSIGIDSAMLDHIEGHDPATVGNSYGEFPIEAQAEAIAKFPRFQVP